MAGERARLASLGALVETAGCRRAILLRHFGEAPPPVCGNCDNCLNPPKSVDASMIAQKFLSAVYRTGQSFGVGHLEKILTGQADDRAKSLGHDTLSVFGIVGRTEAALIKPVARSLLLKDALRTNDHGGLMFGPEAKAYLKGETELRMIVPVVAARTARSGDRGGERGGAAVNPAGTPLFEALRAARRDLAMEAGVPPYVIFHDSTLRDMVLTRPASHAEMAKISGIGTRKLDAYGAAFLDVIRSF